jgi:hypothetical protein
MDKKRIAKLADFFYSSNSANDVPMRISVSIGQYAGFDLSKNMFIDLLEILVNSIDLKNDLTIFVQNRKEDTYGRLDKTA